MRRRGRGWRLLFFLPFWLLIIAMSVGLAVIQAQGYRDAKLELERVTADLQQEQQYNRELQEQQAYYESDSYIEQLAREMLGFVRPDEIVIINTAD